MVFTKKQTSIAIFKRKATMYCIQTLNLSGVTSLSHMHPFSIKIIWDYLNLGSCAQKEPSFQKNTTLSHSSNTIFAIEFSFNHTENQVVHAAIIDGVRSTDISAPVSLIRGKCIPAL